MSDLPVATRTIHDALDAFAAARKEIFEHVGYIEDWCVLPLDDSRDQWWHVDARECHHVKFSPNRDALVHWLKHDDYGPYGNVLYENVIYTNRHLPKWVYRGKDIVLVVADTQTDGNKNLQIFRVDMEVKI